MWLVTLTGKDHRTGGEYRHDVRIVSNSIDDLFNNHEYRWAMLEKLMEQGQLLRVEIDFKASRNGVKRIREHGGLYYLTIDNVLASGGHTDRGEAWARG